MKANKARIYLIQGVFFQNKSGFGTRNDKATVEITFYRTMFAGAIFFDSTKKAWFGQMFDCKDPPFHDGESELFDVELDNDSLRFSKRYLDQESSIQYSLQKTRKEWMGKFNTKSGRTGEVRCVITEVSRDFFQPSEGAYAEAAKEAKEYLRSIS